MGLRLLTCMCCNCLQRWGNIVIRVRRPIVSPSKFKSTYTLGHLNQMGDGLIRLAAGYHVDCHFQVSKSHLEVMVGSQSDCLSLALPL